MDWNYQREESVVGPIPTGFYRIRVKNVEKTTSSTGKKMLKFQFDVSGKASYLFHNIVFLPDHKEVTNRNLTQFFDSFATISEGDFNLAHWVGQVGACKVKHEEYKGEQVARIDYFIAAKNATDLPAWEEPHRKEKDGSTSASTGEGFMDVGAGALDVPF